VRSKARRNQLNLGYTARKQNKTGYANNGEQPESIVSVSPGERERKD